MDYLSKLITSTPWLDDVGTIPEANLIVLLRLMRQVSARAVMAWISHVKNKAVAHHRSKRWRLTETHIYMHHSIPNMIGMRNVKYPILAFVKAHNFSLIQYPELALI